MKIDQPGVAELVFTAADGTVDVYKRQLHVLGETAGVSFYQQIQKN